MATISTAFFPLLSDLPNDRARDLVLSFFYFVLRIARRVRFDGRLTLFGSK